MANKEHVKLLKQGAAKWNSWRVACYLDAGPEGEPICPDLASARLSHADLKEVELIYANLTDADLSGADLNGTALDGADLTRANLSGANLTGAGLTGAKLCGAFLDKANLTGATLTRANLSEADLWETVFADLDLSEVIGLETCKHFGPSVIDYRTLQRSKQLPLEFLRGVGLPDRFIDYIPSLFAQAIEYYSCFISYSTKDQDFAERLHADLQGKGVRCWFAPHDLPIGGKILDEIDAAIRLREKVVLILSEHSIASDWVEDEVTAGFEEERKRGQTVLFPIRLDDAVMDTNEAWAAKLRARNIGDFRQWKDHDGYKKTFDRMLRNLSTSPTQK